MTDIMSMNKEELRAHVRDSGLGYVVDMRKSIETLREELSRFKPKVKTEKARVDVPLFLKNPKTGFFWPYTDLLAARGDLIACDENGDEN